MIRLDDIPLVLHDDPHLVDDEWAAPQAVQQALYQTHPEYPPTGIGRRRVDEDPQAKASPETGPKGQERPEAVASLRS